MKTLLTISMMLITLSAQADKACLSKFSELSKLMVDKAKITRELSLSADQKALLAESFRPSTQQDLDLTISFYGKKMQEFNLTCASVHNVCMPAIMDSLRHVNTYGLHEPLETLAYMERAEAREIHEPETMYVQEKEDNFAALNKRGIQLSYISRMNFDAVEACMKSAGAAKD